MDKDVGRAITGGDEAEAFLGVEELTRPLIFISKFMCELNVTHSFLNEPWHLNPFATTIRQNNSMVKEMNMLMNSTGTI